ncbi:MAG: M14 metallopeptidase family protein [Maribacter sp.]
MPVNQSNYLDIKAQTVKGRYVVNSQIIKFLDDLKLNAVVETVGYSVLQRPIKSITLGSGKHKVLMWSQMHGNESTTTKAVLDLLRFFESNDSLSSKLLETCTLKIIPILNPDGAEAYTRVNANAIDLNRDALDRSQPESVVLRVVYEDFKPHFCFNLHDQRTIFNVGETSKPATVSFLAPSHDAERTISETRKISMQLIAAMNQKLQKIIPGQIGRYDDGFNPNCVGDTFQMLNTPTILFEAGHYHEDYEREKTREYIYYALQAALTCIGENDIYSYSEKDYFKIPENNKLFFDIKIKNAQLIHASYTKDVGILLAEVLKGEQIFFEPRIEKVGCLEWYFGHQTFDCAIETDFIALKNQKFWNLLQI